MSDTPRSFDQLARPSMARQVSWELADHVWLETLFKQRRKMLGDIISRVFISMEDEIADRAWGDSDITDEEIAEYWTWKTEIQQEQAGWDSRLLALEQSRPQIETAYQQLAESKGCIALEPSYIIDPTEPEWRLTIQREFAVEREARMIRWGIEPERIERWAVYKATPKGRYYVGRRICYEPGPSAGLKAECEAITAFLEENHGNTADEYEAAYQDKPWLPEVITRWSCYKRRNGRHASDEDWWKVQRKIGYWLPEVVLLSIKNKRPLEEEHADFYEGNADSGPRRVARTDPLMQLDIRGDVVEEEAESEESI